MAKSISVFELKKIINDPQVALIDVREQDEYQEEHIKEAILLPLAIFSLKKLPQGYTSYVMQCRSGARSQEACHRILQENPTLQVFNLDGGILAWKKAGFETQGL
jgi:rhodanese-related sulfurtransferase